PASAGLQLNIRDPHARQRAAMPAALAEALAPLLLEDAQLRPARFAVDDANHLRIGDKRRTGDDVARVLLDEQHLLEGELLALFTGGPVDFDDRSRSDFDLAAARLDDRVHVDPLAGSTRSRPANGSAQPGLHKGFSLTHEKGRPEGPPLRSAGRPLRSAGRRGGPEGPPTAAGPAFP